MPILTRTSQLKWNELGRAIDVPDSLNVNGGMKRGQQRRGGEEVSLDNDQHTAIHPDRVIHEQREWFMRMEGASDEMLGWMDRAVQVNLNTVLFACFIKCKSTLSIIHNHFWVRPGNYCFISFQFTTTPSTWGTSLHFALPALLQWQHQYCIQMPDWLHTLRFQCTPALIITAANEPVGLSRWPDWANPVKKSLDTPLANNTESQNILHLINRQWEILLPYAMKIPKTKKESELYLTISIFIRFEGNRRRRWRSQGGKIFTGNAKRFPLLTCW